MKTKTKILAEGSLLEISWSDKRAQYHAIWLRDNGQDANTRDPSNFQKLITLQDIPEPCSITHVALVSSTQLELTFAPDNFQTHIDLNWLKANRYDDETKKTSLFEDQIEPWDSALSQNIPTGNFQEIKNNSQALKTWLLDVQKYGFALLQGLTNRNTAVLDVIELFGFVRETNYGKYFEIRSEINPVNLAYTNQGLQCHTDNPYREPIPGLQLFNCLENSAKGGESIVVDGFKVAELIKMNHPHYFSLLETYQANFSYKGSQDIHLKASRPLIQTNHHGTIYGIAFNNRSTDALTDTPFDMMPQYYQAYRLFGALVDSPQQQVIFKLKPGELFITDNTRVLHGRTAFSGKGYRWMRGAYADKDSLYSKIRTL